MSSQFYEQHKMHKFEGASLQDEKEKILSQKT